MRFLGKGESSHQRGDLQQNQASPKTQTILAHQETQQSTGRTFNTIKSIFSTRGTVSSFHIQLFHLMLLFNGSLLGY